MKLNSRKPPVPAQSNQPVTAKSRTFGKYIYLIIVFIAFIGLGRWGIAQLYYIKSPGILSGVEVSIESPIKAVVNSLPLAIGDKVKKGDPLAVLYDVELQEKISRQQGEINRLQAEEQKEKQQLDILIEEQKSQIALAKSQALRNKEDLIGQIEVLSLKEKNTKERTEQMRGLFLQTKKLYQLEAVLMPRFLEVKMLLEDSGAKLETIYAELRAARKKLSHVEEEIKMLDRKSFELPKTIKAKSSLPILTVEIESAKEQLQLLQKSLQEQTLRSSLTGVVNQVFKKEKEVVMPGESLLSVIDPTGVFVKAYFQQKEEVYLHVNEKVELLFDNGQKEQGIIKKFYPATGPLPPQFQERYQPRQHALIAEIISKKNGTWPLTLGMGVQVHKKRF